MTHLGSPEQWGNLIESQVPDILALVIETWEAMPPPAGNELEDVVSESLCRALRQSRNSRDLPFRIDTQLVELDPAAGQDQGRMDIVFSPAVPRENIYFCLECKRINVRDENGVRACFVEYVRHGMFRFVRGQYANSVQHGGMLAFVLNGDVVGAINGVGVNVQKLFTDLGMDAPGVFLTSSLRPNDSRVRETQHRRGNQQMPFVIHHMFVAGDPEAPLRPMNAPSNPSEKAPKRKTETKKRTLRKKPHMKGTDE